MLHSSIRSKSKSTKRSLIWIVCEGIDLQTGLPFLFVFARNLLYENVFRFFVG